MSCQRPLSVLNKSLYFRFGLDKARNIVNCGQCESCLNSIKNDYLVRSYFHRMECVGIDFNGKRFKDQGFVLFPTLTYKKKLRPKYHYTLDGQNYTIEGFSHDHIRKFVKQLQDRFHDLYPEALKTEKITYMICSEYGYNNVYQDENGRLRKGQNAPHYHCLLYMPARCADRVKFYTKRGKERVMDGKQYWTYYVQNNWSIVHDDGTKEKLGRVDYSREYGAIISPTNVKAIRYVVEYACKQHDYYRITPIAKYLLQDVPVEFALKSSEELSNMSAQELQKYFSIKNEYSSLIKKRRDEIKHILPNHWQSIGYGSYMVQWLLSMDDHSRLDVIRNGFTVPGDTKFQKEDLNLYKVPKYILDKLYVDEYHAQVYSNKDNKIINRVYKKEFNDLARHDYQVRYDLDFKSQRFKLFTQLQESRFTRFTDADVRKFSKGTFVTIDYFRSYVRDMLSTYGLDYILSYKKVRNIAFRLNNQIDIYNYNLLSNSYGEDFNSFARSIYLDKVMASKYVPINRDMPQCLHEYRALDIPYYVEFKRPDIDQLLQVVDGFERQDSHNRYQSFLKKKEEKEIIKRAKKQQLCLCL